MKIVNGGRGARFSCENISVNPVVTCLVCNVFSTCTTLYHRDVVETIFENSKPDFNSNNVDLYKWENSLKTSYLFSVKAYSHYYQ